MSNKTAAETAAELTAEERQKVKSLYKTGTIIMLVFVVILIVNLVLMFTDRAKFMDYYDRWGALSDKQNEVSELMSQVSSPSAASDPEEAEQNLALLEKAQAKTQEIIDEIDVLQKETPVETEGKSASEIRLALLDKVDAVTKRSLIVMAVAVILLLAFLGIFKSKNPLFSEKLYKEVRKLEKGNADQTVS